MLRTTILCITVLVALSSGPRQANASQVPKSGEDGVILDQRPCEFGSYDQQSEFTKRFYSRDDYNKAKVHPEVSCFRIKYWSDGLRVIGYLVQPRNTSFRRFPVIIFNRGGFLDLGKIEPFNLIDLQRLSKDGFVVLASQYRGNDGGEGREQLGGQDLDDVSNLLNTAKTLRYADTRNVFMYGVSRGGMMTFLEMKREVHINAAAVVGAVYDLAAFRDRAPGLVDKAAELIPNYSEIGLPALKDRSVMDWPNAVNVPLLMIHGADDEEVPVTEALAFATKLSNLKKTYELIVYAGDVHEAAKNRVDRDSRITTWFRSYMR
jgi:dipeptidyl aminopeptidase/acylaminoacyl peptidase